MPNWCVNVLEVLDDKVNLKEKLIPFLEAGGDIDFQKIKPCPETYYKDDRWHDWCVKNWGTKWSADGCSFSSDGKSVLFSTAWNPPTGIVEELSKILELDLRLIYSESGADFHGEYQCFKDGYSSEECYSYKNLPDDLKNELEEAFSISEDYGDIEE